MNTPSFYDFAVADIQGQLQTLEVYRNKVVLLVNVASKCGLTPQYEALQKLYETCQPRGLEILGFPANNFMSQEPGSNEEIAQFCSLTYGVTFPLFAKVSVRGNDKHPLFRFLTDKKLHPGYGGEIKWNFTKFLIDRQGSVCGRFGPMVSPDAGKLVKAVELCLR